MITDKIENIFKYSEIPQVAKDFILNLSSDVSLGKMILTNDIYANVESYLTKSLNEAKFEAHKKYADIQIILKGIENIYYTDKSQLSVGISYNEDKDIEFFSDDVKPYPNITLDGSNFVLLLPHEAHAPQVCLNNQNLEVKKAVIKIKI